MEAAAQGVSVVASVTALLLAGIAVHSPPAQAVLVGTGVRAVGLERGVVRRRAVLASHTRGPAVAVPFAEGDRVTVAGAVVRPERLLVRFRGNVSAAQAAQVRRSTGATLMRSFQLLPGLELLRTSSGRTGLETAAALSRNPAIRYAVPDLVASIQAVPDDPLYGQQWGPASIGAPEAWGFSTGSRSVIVAVLDTGITLNHPDLEGNIWTNPNPGQGGYAGDLHGWNFVANNNDPADDNGHGTHVSGIIGAVGNNGIGVSGVNWSVSLMPLKICNSSGECSLSDEIAALEYAVAHGAKVANASFGGDYGGYLPEQEAIAAAGKHGLLYVAAAGNHESNDDLTPFYPASYSLENELSVAATTSSDTLASFSNFGFTSVDLGAPGQGILSTLPTSGTYSSSTGYGELSGTSMAAPQVSGAAALLMSEHPDWTMQHVRARLIATTRPLASLVGRAASCGELDIGAASDPTTGEQASVCAAPSGTGAGTITSEPVGIDCGTSCSARYTPGTQIKLGAEPAAGSRFVRWGGACTGTGTGTCSVSPTLTTGITATFDATTAAPGWEDEPLAPPAGQQALAPGSLAEFSFFNLSISAAGTVRAKTIYHEEEECRYASSNTGGVWVEEKIGSAWTTVAALVAPPLGSDRGRRWAKCSQFGTVTELSADGSTLLITPNEGSTINAELGTRDRCAAFIYRHGAKGWKLNKTLYPPGVTAQGSTNPEACKFFGIGGAINANGTYVAILADGFVDVYARGRSGWSLQQHILQPSGPGCEQSIGPMQLALSGDGTHLLVGDPNCNDTAGDIASGRLYAYTRVGSSWTLSQTFESPEPQKLNDFGEAVAISGDGTTAAVSVGREVSGLPFGAGASWILRDEAGSWRFSTRLTAPTPQEGQYFSCPTILQNATRILCTQADTVGYNDRQGSLYLFEQPTEGWISQTAPTRLFAVEGAAGDSLGTSDYYKWPSFAATADGKEIEATISNANLANSTYPNDRIGYTFTTTG